MSLEKKKGDRVNERSRKWSGNDYFFAFQILMAYGFALPQVMRMFVSVKGVTINWLLCADLFVVLNLFLAAGTYRKIRTRANLQTLLIYANWVALVTPMVVITFFRCPWTQTDTWIAILVGLSATAVSAWSTASGRGLKDPVVRGMLVGLFRVVPHLYLSFCMLKAGSGAGVAMPAIWAANITASARIITLFQTGRKSGWEKGIRASFLSELGNEASWLLVTGIWLSFR